MPQAFLGSNPGTVVQDAIAPELIDEQVDGETITGPWVEVGSPGHCVAVMELGTMGASTALVVELQGSDTGSGGGTNVVSYGGFDTVGQDDDDEVRVRDLQVYKRYMRAVATESAGDAGNVRITIAPPQFMMGNTRTA